MNSSALITRQAPRTTMAHEAVALFALLAVWLLFFWRVFAPIDADRVQFAPGDFTQQFLVARQFALDELRQGRWPLWMPCIDSGYPYQADPQSALFYPPMLLNVAWHVVSGAQEFSINALELEAALHVLLAALLAYGFLRGEVRQRAAALIGALAFAFGGYLTGYPILQLAILESAVWLPLALWAARRLAARGDIRSMALLSLPLALSILAGHPQTYTFIFYLTAIYFVYRARRERSSWRFIGVRLIGAIGLALMLSAVQLLPSFEYARLSSRTDLPYTVSGAGLPLADILQLIVTSVVSHFNPLYVGVLPLAFALFAAGSRRKNDDTPVWLIVAVAGVLISFGSHLAVFDGVYWFAPGYRVFRDQERHALIVNFALSVLAAYGVDAVLHGLSRRARTWLRTETRWLAIGLVLLIVALAVTLYLSGQGADRNWAERIALATLALAFTIGVFALRSNRAARRWLPIVMVAIVGFDLASANREVNWVKPYDPFPSQPAIEAIRADTQSNSLFRIHNEQRLPGHSACVNGLDEVGSITPIHIDRYARFIQNVPREVRWQLLNVRYVVTWRSVLDDHLGQPVDVTLLAQQGEGKDASYTYRLNRDNPRVWIVHDVESRLDGDAILTAISDPGFDPRRVAYTESPVSVVKNEASEPLAITTFEPNYISLDARLTTPGLLVLSEVNYPGWKATVNGTDVPIIGVDGLLRGVVLPAGPAHVEMQYQPMSLAIGGILSVIGLLIGLGLWLVRDRKPAG